MVIDDNRVRPWTITWRGYVWHEDESNLTAGDVCALQVLVGDGWSSANPWASPLHLASMIAVLYARQHNEDPATVLALVMATPADDFLGAIGPRSQLAAVV